MDSLEVEVHLNGAYHKGFVTNVYETEVSVVFENDLQPESRFGFDLVRLPPVDTAHVQTFKVDEEVEIYTRVDDREPPGWWLAVIKNIESRRRFNWREVAFKKIMKYTVERLSRENGKTIETLSSDKIRRKNTNLSINRTTFIQFEVEVPEELGDYAKTEEGVQIFRDGFQNSTHSSVCRYLPEKGVLSIISRSVSYENKETLRRHINMRYLEQLRMKRKEEGSWVELDEPEPCTVYVRRLQVRMDLMGLAIGKRGENINRAWEIDNIITIQHEKNSNVFIIYGNTIEAVEAARKTLEYCEDYVLVPEDALGIVLGEEGEAIEKVIEESGDVRWKIYEMTPHIPRRERHTLLVFVGKAESVVKARSLVEKQLLKLNEEKLQLSNSLSKEK